MQSSLSTSSDSSAENFSLTSQQQIRAFMARAQAVKGVTHYTLALWLAVGEIARKSEYWRVGTQWLAEELGMSIKAVRRHAAILERMGMIQRQRANGQAVDTWGLTQDSDEMEAAAQVVAARQASTPTANLQYPRRRAMTSCERLAAAIGGVSGRTIAYAKKIQRESPEMGERVRRGELTIRAALKELKALKELGVS